VILFFQGAYGDAIPQLRAALKLKPTLWKIQALLGIGEKRAGDIDASRHDLEQAFPKVQEEKIRIEAGMELVEIYSGTGDLDKAAAMVSVLRKLDPTNEAVLYTAYRVYSDLVAESLLSLLWWTRIPPACTRRWRTNWRSAGTPRKRLKITGPRLKIDPQLPDSILSWPICSTLCRLQKAGKKRKKSTRQHWRLIPRMNRRNADWAI